MFEWMDPTDAPPEQVGWQPSVLDLLHGSEPAAVAAQLARPQPGPVVLTALSMIDPARLGLGERLSCLEAWERAAAWVASGQARALAAMEAPLPPGAAGAGASPGSRPVSETATSRPRRCHVAVSAGHAEPGRKAP